MTKKAEVLKKSLLQIPKEQTKRIYFWVWRCKHKLEYENDFNFRKSIELAVGEKENFWGKLMVIIKTVIKINKCIFGIN